MKTVCVPVLLDQSTRPDVLLPVILEAGARMIELRCDIADGGMFREWMRAINLVEKRLSMRLHTIVTVRPDWEGGLFTGSDQQRALIFAEAIAAGVTFVDVELRTIKEHPDLWNLIFEFLDGPDARTMPICSHHHFSDEPFNPRAKLAEMRALPNVAMDKLVWKAKSVADAALALRLMRENHDSSRPLLAVAMGEEGRMSRLLAGAFGAFFGFGTVHSHPSTAPGQPSVSELLFTYQCLEQDFDTRVFGVIGFPLKHSLSPVVHNAAFAACPPLSRAHNSVYVPIPVPPGQANFNQAMAALTENLGPRLRGVSVTIPHKENAFAWVRQRGTLSADALVIGAINTIIFDDVGGTPYGFNTDRNGALAALCAGMKITPEALRGKRAAIVGAGGAARAIVSALTAAGMNVTVYNRTPGRAAALARDFADAGGTTNAAPWSELPESRADVYVQCTPVGMYPDVDATPLPRLPRITPRTVFFDTIYNPPKTRLMRDARAAGAIVIGGLEMFVQQAALQFERFAERDAPIDLMRETARKALYK